MDASLESEVWCEVQEKLVTAQTEHMMCIHKQELTPLDVYHRILRFNNYIVAMVNKVIFLSNANNRLSVPLTPGYTTPALLCAFPW